MAPFITWQLLNSRFVGHKAAVAARGDQASQNAFLQTCMEHHSATEKYMKSTKGQQRCDVVNASAYPDPGQLGNSVHNAEAACEPRAMEVDAGGNSQASSSEDDSDHEHVIKTLFETQKQLIAKHDQHSICAAKFIAAIKRELLLYDVSFAPSVNFALKLSYVGSSTAALQKLEEEGIIWLLVHKFGNSKYWM
eukprot:12409552-Karenia_brevis.AAC.1